MMHTARLLPLALALVVLVSMGSLGVAANPAAATDSLSGDSNDATATNATTTAEDVEAQQAPPGDWDLLHVDGQSGERTLGIDTISAQHTAETFYIKADYHGDFTQEDEIDLGIFLDTDQDVDTGLNKDNEEMWYYMDDIGADYAAVAGLEGNSVWQWMETDTTWNQEYQQFNHIDFDYADNTVVVGIDRGSIGDPDAVDILTADAVEGSQSEWDYAPDRNEGHLTYDFDTQSDNTPPEASFNYTPTDPVVSESVSFDAGASEDVDGSIESYEWDLNGNGSTDKNGVTATYQYETTGEYNVTLTVTDSSGATATTSQTVVVNDSNGANGADIVVEDTVMVNGSTVTINTGGSAAVAIDSFDPSDTDVGDLSGVGQAQPGGAIWNGPDETVSFTLTPPNSVDPGDTIEFNVTTDRTRTVSLDVVEEPTVEAPPGVSQEAAKVVANEDGEFTPSSIVLAINENAQTGSVNGVEIAPSEFALIISANAENDG